MAHGERVIQDSLFIAEYLCSSAPDCGLFSQESFVLAQIRMWNAFDMGFCHYDSDMHEIRRWLLNLDEVCSDQLQGKEVDLDVCSNGVLV